MTDRIKKKIDNRMQRYETLSAEKRERLEEAQKRIGKLATELNWTHGEFYNILVILLGDILLQLKDPKAYVEHVRHALMYHVTNYKIEDRFGGDGKGP